MKLPFVRFIFAATLALALQQPGFAADTPSSAPDKLSQARSLIKDKKWADAIDELKRVNDPANADWNNLMGYSLRKAKTPDLDGAERYYNEALRIDPNHRGAHEYIAEAYLMTGNLAKAKEHLAQLDRICTLGCAEYARLKKEIAVYEQQHAKH